MSLYAEYYEFCHINAVVIWLGSYATALDIISINGRYVKSVKEFALRVAHEVESYKRRKSMDPQQLPERVIGNYLRK
jgi:hypothetical protein